MQPVLLLETRISPIGFLTSRSLVIDSISSQGRPIEYCRDYLDIEGSMCYGCYYILLDEPDTDLVIIGSIGDEQYRYRFTL
jgi:hypothetical protein